MTYTDLIQLYFERSNALQWLWTLYVIVIGGLLAFSTMRKERDRFTTILVTFLFCFFAYKNLDAIHDITIQRFAVLDAIKNKQFYSPPPALGASHSLPPDESVNGVSALLNPTLLPIDYNSAYYFHKVSDALTIALLWVMELRRKRLAKAKQASAPAA